MIARYASHGLSPSLCISLIIVTTNISCMINLPAPPPPPPNRPPAPNEDAGCVCVEVNPPPPAILSPRRSRIKVNPRSQVCVSRLTFKSRTKPKNRRSVDQMIPRDQIRGPKQNRTTSTLSIAYYKNTCRHSTVIKLDLNFCILPNTHRKATPLAVVVVAAVRCWR